MSDLERFPLGYGARVSAEFPLDRWGSSPVITVRTKRDNGWQLELSACDARSLARRLTAMANVIDPPKKRK